MSAPPRKPGPALFARQQILTSVLLGCGAVVAIAGCAGRQPEPATELQPVQPTQLEGTRWTAERILGKSARVTQSVLEFRAPGQAGGNGGCNSFQGGVTIKANKLEFGPIASTRRMCAPAISGQETVFLEALELAHSWQRTGEVLELLDAGGTVVMVLIGGDPAAD